MSHIDELRDVIRRLHGVESSHVASVPIKETFQGHTVWDGVVEVFELIGHPSATKLYAWSHATDDPENPWRHVTVLHSHPVTSPVLAVRAAILQEIRGNAPAEA
jgi:predicted transcriptional regulator